MGTDGADGRSWGAEQQARARPRPWGPCRGSGEGTPPHCGGQWRKWSRLGRAWGGVLGGPWRSGHGGLALPGPWEGSWGSRSCPRCGPAGSAHPLSPFTDEETEAEELGGHRGGAVPGWRLVMRVSLPRVPASPPRFRAWPLGPSCSEWQVCARLEPHVKRASGSCSSLRLCLVSPTPQPQPRSGFGVPAPRPASSLAPPSSALPIYRPQHLML